MLTQLVYLITGIAGFQSPAPDRYLIHIIREEYFDASVMGAGGATVSNSLTAWVTATQTDTIGGELVDLVVDSAKIGSTVSGSSLSEVRALAGVRFHLYVVDGRPSRYPEASLQTEATAALTASVALLFPTPNSHVKPGETWVDTVTTRDMTSTERMEGTSITKWSAKRADTTLKLEGQTSGSVSVLEPGVPNVASASTGLKHVSLASDGTLLSAESTVRTNIEMETDQGLFRVNALTTITIVRLR